jgi:hypothetical protein
MRHRPVHAKKNVAFLIPFVPLLVPALVGGAGLYVAGKVAKTAMAPYINAPAVLGGSAGYLAAKIGKQSMGVQAAAVLVGYLGGLMIGKATAKQADKTQVQQIMTEEGVKTTAEAEKIAEWRKWCKEHNWLAYTTPQCYYYQA